MTDLPARLREWAEIHDVNGDEDMFEPGLIAVDLRSAAARLEKLEEVLAAARKAAQRCDRLHTKGRLESGIVTLDADDFDPWFIRDELAEAIRAADEVKA